MSDLFTRTRGSVRVALAVIALFASVHTVYAQPRLDVNVLDPANAFPSLTSTDRRAEVSVSQTPDATVSTFPTSSGLSDMISPQQLTPTLRTVAFFAVLSLAPAVLVMSTCFVRFAIVLGILRHALGAQQWLPNQIVVALSLFLTLLVMGPVWQESYDTGIRPYTETTYATSADEHAALTEAFTRASRPVREFMSTQIAATHNEAAIDLLLSYQASQTGETAYPGYYEDVPLTVLLPAYLLSELKTAFLVGFQILLPFLVIDLVVASVLTAIGLMMLPPVLVALPFKLLLFVLIDGWFLTVELLLAGIAPS